MSPTDWTLQVQWMREHGVTKAEWGQSGELLKCELSSATPETPSPALTDEQIKAREAEEQPRVDELDFGAA
jgi:hypothetical protein